ncbi:hypothetical protein [Pelosinus baikalensis]|uniref:Uncharacterized protein n=1 Tax=Pelosinus baikalensis TaxID=2892015 RepID=A0ABS8HU13_9FIRM|nr:hypothetical protein [Pelosinus baikalensis]MCC5466655.1 hypothetical protein [Pelosinus baikalensis]
MENKLKQERADADENLVGAVNLHKSKDICPKEAMLNGYLNHKTTLLRFY